MAEQQETRAARRRVARRWSGPARVGLALALVVAATGLAVLVPAGPALAYTDSAQIPAVRNVSSAIVPAGGVSPAVKGHVGVDILLTGAPDSYNPCKSESDSFVNACTHGLGSYYHVHHFDNGPINFPLGIFINNADKGITHNWANKVRDTHLEYYPYGPGGTYDPWTQDYGGVAYWSGDFSGAYSAPVGTVPLPQRGAANVGRLGGRVLSTTAVTTGRVHSDVFQVENWSASSSGGRPVGGFATLDNRNAQWTTGWVFNGSYLAVITDRVTGVTLSARFDVQGDRTVDLDLDAPCFGFEVCVYQSGGPPTVTGQFHDLTPARIFDTRFGIGHDTSKVSPGDGRNSDPNPFKRLATRVNHEAQVTGVGGVPASGVGAVLLNVTAVDPTADSHLTVFPKPPGVGDIFNDQSSFQTVPTASNLNFRARQTVANLVLAKVGAGGKVRLFNNAGDTHVVMDVVGWFDDGHDPGADFTGVTPARDLDSRDGTGTIRAPFGPQESRDLTVAGVNGVPADATAVVVNTTAVFPNAASHLTVWPAGLARPGVSNVNFGAGQIVPNLVVVKVGQNGRISLFNNAGSTEVLVDVVGYYRPGAVGGRLTPSAPTRILDTRSNVGLTGAFSTATRDLTVRGAAGVPSGATAVVLNVTAVGPSALSHITVWPAGQAVPVASNLNVVAGQTVPNLVMVKLGDQGRVSIRNNSGTTHLVADVVGWYS